MKSFAAAHLKRGGALVIDESSSTIFEFQNYPLQLFKVPFDLHLIFKNYQSIHKNFTIDSITVQEIVAKESKAKARRAVSEAIKNAFWSQKLPYAHVWYYPAGYRSLFSFRFDMDEYYASDHNEFIDLLKEAKGAVSCFACMKTYENFPDAIDEVLNTGVELASHAYVHHIYHNKPQNNWNLNKAAKLLSPKTGTVRGFTAPHGKWHPTLQEALEENSYDYSSEFSLDYDNFPFFPFYNGEFSNVLQIPTHPICDGVFPKESAFDFEMFEKYYNPVIQYKLENREPILFFSHPAKRLGPFSKVFRFIYEKVRNNPLVWLAEYREIATWWKKRHQANVQLDFNNEQVQISNLEDPFEIHVLYPDQSEEWLKSNGENCSKNVQKEATFNNAKMPSEMDHKHTFLKQWKLTLKYFLDWEIKTPVLDIIIVDTSSLLKKILRFFYSKNEESVYGA